MDRKPNNITADVAIWRQKTIKEVTLTLNAGVAYATGDVLANTQEIADAMKEDGGIAVIHSIALLDKDDQGQALDLVFLKTNVSLGVENSAVSITDLNADEILGIIEIAATDYVDLVNSQHVTKEGLGIVVESASDSKSLFVGVISRGNGTYSASGITLKIGLLLH